jgi:hypothetical protein
MRDVRHTLAHGIPLKLGQQLPVITRNHCFLGESRKRPTTGLVVSELTLDRALDVLDTLFMVLGRVGSYHAGQIPIEFALELEQRASSARDQAITLNAELHPA